MATWKYPNYPLPLTPEQSEYLLSNIKDWSILNGLAVRPSPSFVPKEVDPSGSLAVTAPVTLFPSLFPRLCFEEAKAIQIVYNELYAAIARDEEWLREIVEEYEYFLVLVLSSALFTYIWEYPGFRVSKTATPLFTPVPPGLYKHHELSIPNSPSTG